MRISGYQPLSLIDYPGVICATVFTQGCAFRCPYCHNPELIPHKAGAIEETEVFRHLDLRRSMIEGVCVTGGEPTLHADLGDLLRGIKQRGLLVKLDTNGVNPEMVRGFIAEGIVDMIAMDIKHTWERYDDVARTGSARAIENCRKTYDLITSSGVAYEFRTTVSPALHSEDELVTIACQLPQGAHYALQAIRYDKMLDPAHPRGVLDLERAASRILEERPDLALEIRGR